MSLDLVIQRGSDTENRADNPEDEDFQTWVTAALAERVSEHCTVTIRLVDAAEMTDLNQQYRGKVGTTNVLSFASELPPEILAEMAVRPLGDVVICQSVLTKEAHDQGKPLRNHWAHLVIHGILHLLGYDHIQHEEAECMEKLEVEILAGLGIPDPYSE